MKGRGASHPSRHRRRPRARAGRTPLARLLGAAAGGLLLLAGSLQAAYPPPTVATDGMVVTDCTEASRVGAEVLRQGGNAVDAAIAVSFALAVAYPQAGNIGGGGFMIVRMAGGPAEAIDFREVAPGAASRNMFLGPDGRPDPRLSTETLLASGVPGAVAGMAMAHERYATRPWGELLQPAILLAKHGFALDRYTAGHFVALQTRLAQHPEARRIYLNDGQFRAEGDTLRQPELAETLMRIARQGPREFYEGETARLILAEMARGGGIISAADLRGYRPLLRSPLIGRYRGYDVCTMPPPSSGGIALLQMLSYLEPTPMAQLGPQSSRQTHLLAEVMKRAFADRAEFLGDADHVPVPVAGLLDPAYLDSVRAGIDFARATPALLVGPGYPDGAAEFYEATGGTPGPDIRAADSTGAGGEGRETTHYSIVDRLGNAVAVTTTLNTSYGSGQMVTGAGFLLNNEMDDFAAMPGSPNYYGLIQGEGNAVRPFARPLSSMTPTIVTRGDTLALVLGSPGGPKIITSVFQTLINVLDNHMDIQAAIAAPRVHHQWWPDTLYVEPEGLTADVAEALERMGHHLAGGGYAGSVQGIQVVQLGDRHLLLGASDPRRNGKPVGVSGTRLIER
jgi:gamma-glutamyltranspeptidase/glutathione hydrolase